MAGGTSGFVSELPQFCINTFAIVSNIFQLSLRSSERISSRIYQERHTFTLPPAASPHISYSERVVATAASSHILFLENKYRPGRWLRSPVAQQKQNTFPLPLAASSPGPVRRDYLQQRPHLTLPFRRTGIDRAAGSALRSEIRLEYSCCTVCWHR